MRCVAWNEQAIVLWKHITRERKKKSWKALNKKTNFLKNKFLLRRTKERKQNFNPAIGNFLRNLPTAESQRAPESLRLNVGLLSSSAKSLAWRCLAVAASLILESLELDLELSGKHLKVAPWLTKRLSTTAAAEDKIVFDVKLNNFCFDVIGVVVWVLLSSYFVILSPLQW